MRGMRPAALQVRPQIRERHRLAEFLRAPGWRRRYHERQELLHDPHRGALRPLRRTSWPRVRRRPAAYRPALLHQRRGAQFRTRVVSRRERGRSRAEIEEDLARRSRMRTGSRAEIAENAEERAA